MQKRLRQLFTRAKERSSVGYAKAATAAGFCDIDLIIIKATTPDDLPLSEKYVSELLKIFSISPSSFHRFALSFVRRFGNTHCWRVALKCLLLLHRLLHSLPENSPFRTELLWARANRLFSLYPCHFRDESSANPEDYTKFIRSYAKLLNEALDCVALDSKATYNEEEVPEPEDFCDKRKEVGTLIEVLPQLQSLIDRVMDCRPSGASARNFIVQIAMKHIIRDSFICYTTYRREIVLVLDNLFQMPYRSCILAFGIYKKAAMQANQLCEFYDWCKASGFCGVYEYPFVDRVPQIHIQALETFLNGMWQLPESPSSSSSPSSLLGSPSTLTATLTEEDGDYKQIVKKDIVVISDQWEKFEEAGFGRDLESERALIQFEESENDNSWEDILDASVDLPTPCPSVAQRDATQRKMQLHNPQAVNPFYQPWYTYTHNHPSS